MRRVWIAEMMPGIDLAFIFAENIRRDLRDSGQRARLAHPMGF
jgi:hypothetical protein